MDNKPQASQPDSQQQPMSAKQIDEAIEKILSEIKTDRLSPWQKFLRKLRIVR